MAYVIHITKSAVTCHMNVIYYITHHVTCDSCLTNQLGGGTMRMEHRLAKFKIYIVLFFLLQDTKQTFFKIFGKKKINI